MPCEPVLYGCRAEVHVAYLINGDQMSAGHLCICPVVTVSISISDALLSHLTTTTSTCSSVLGSSKNEPMPIDFVICLFMYNRHGGKREVAIAVVVCFTASRRRGARLVWYSATAAADRDRATACQQVSDQTSNAAEWLECFSVSWCCSGLLLDKHFLLNLICMILLKVDLCDAQCIAVEAAEATIRKKQRSLSQCRWDCVTDKSATTFLDY